MIFVLRASLWQTHVSTFHTITGVQHSYADIPTAGFGSRWSSHRKIRGGIPGIQREERFIYPPGKLSGLPMFLSCDHLGHILCLCNWHKKPIAPQKVIYVSPETEFWVDGAMKVFSGLRSLLQIFYVPYINAIGPPEFHAAGRACLSTQPASYLNCVSETLYFFLFPNIILLSY